MSTRVPYFVDTKPRLRGSQLFYVDPNVTTEGVVPAVPGSIFNYPYRLPFLQHNFPVRQIRLLLADNLLVDPVLNRDPYPALITLRKADGTYLLEDFPVSEFIVRASFGQNIRPLIFGDDFFPDPSMSFVKYMQDGITERMALEFRYG